MQGIITIAAVMEFIITRISVNVNRILILCAEHS